MGGVLYAATRNVMSILFVVLSPLMLLGSFLENRIAGKRQWKQGQAEFRAALRDLAVQLRYATDREQQQRRREHPSVGEVTVGVSSLTPLTWTRRPRHDSFLEVRLGLGTLPSRNSVATPSSNSTTPEMWREMHQVIDEFSTVERVPVVADLRECGGIGVAGPPLASFPLACSVMVQIAGLHSPAEVVLAAIALYVLICVIVTPPLRRLIDERFRRGAESQAFLVESVTGVMTLKAAAVEPQMQTRWERLLSAYVRAGFDAAKLQIWGGQAIQLVSKLSTVLVLFIGARLAISGQLSVGELVAFNMLAARVAEPVLRLAGLWTQFQEARVGVQRLGDILNSPTESTFQPSRSALPTIRGAVTFDDVTFRYAVGGREVLRGVSISANPGEVIGIVGPSGSGKSTLTKLVQRLYVPESGRVLVDGVDLALVDPAWLRRQIGVVLQENLLFNRTVRENIALADPGTSMEAVIQAAQLAGAHDFILELSQGYDTQIEERGANLSGGQRQRIAIARALITDPRILILDEATSALDAESEAIIHTNMRQIIQGRTVLIIAHRLSAIRIAQRIVTLEAGEITEQGSHESLMAAGGRYSRMWRAQTEGTWA
jgi:HlyB family type I secretion system ABC transporter